MLNFSKNVSKNVTDKPMTGPKNVVKICCFQCQLYLHKYLRHHEMQLAKLLKLNKTKSNGYLLVRISEHVSFKL